MALRSEGTRQFAYIAAVEDLARHQDAWTARFAAKRLEIRTPLRIEGDSWSIRVVLAPLFIGCATLAFLFWLKRAVQKQRQIGLELKVPPVALAVIAAALMWCARIGHAGLRFPVPFKSDVPGGSGAPWRTYVSCRRCRVPAGEDHSEPDEAGLHVVSGGLRNLQVYS